jgi:hypothetical protein
VKSGDEVGGGLLVLHIRKYGPRWCLDLGLVGERSGRVVAALVRMACAVANIALRTDHARRVAPPDKELDPSGERPAQAPSDPSEAGKVSPTSTDLVSCGAGALWVCVVGVGTR